MGPVVLAMDMPMGICKLVDVGETRLCANGHRVAQDARFRVADAIPIGCE